jgi:hypothetical protein
VSQLRSRFTSGATAAAAVPSLLALSLLPFLATPRGLHAQDAAASAPAAPNASTPVIAPAAVVRLGTPGLEGMPSLIGTVQSVDSVGVTVRTVRETWTVPWSMVRTAEVRVGERPAWRASLTGAVFGSLFGAVAYRAVPFFATRHDTPHSVVIQGAVGGAAIGALVGRWGARDLWRRVPPRPSAAARAEGPG